MKNAHFRFGWLTYVKTTEKVVTNIRLRLDRFIGEVLPGPSREAKAHLISVLGGDTQIAAVFAAISMGERFMVEGPGVPPIRVCLDRDPHCYKGSLQLAGRKKPLRHLIGISDEFAASGALSGTDRTLLADSGASFVWSSLARIHGIPGIPDWAEWFLRQLEMRKAVVPMLGLGCSPVLVKGNKEQFLSWLGDGLWGGDIRFPVSNGSNHWPSLELKQLLFPTEN